MFGTRLVPAALLAAAVLLTASCSKTPAKPGGGGTSVGGLCTRNPAALAKKPACIADDTCPCGAHCELGACQSDCIADADCGTGTCDAFGTCRRAGDTAVVPPLSPVTEGDIFVAPAHIPSVSVEGAIQKLRVVPRLMAPGKVRVAADAGLQVRCDPTGTFAADCTLTMAAADASVEVEVQSAKAFTPGEVRTVHVFAGTKMRSTSFEAPAVQGVANPVEGNYAGSAERIGAGVGNDAPLTLGADLTLPITARIHGEPGSTPAILSIDDVAALLDPSGTWVGNLVQSGEVQAQFPDRLLSTGQAFAATPYEVVLHADVAPVLIGDSPRSLLFEVVIHTQGILASGRDPWTRWRVSLSRQGAVDGTAPAVPAAYVPTLSASRAGTALPFEAAVRAAFPQVGLSAFDLQDHLLRCTVTPGGSCTPQPGLNSCELGADERVVLAQRASLLERPGTTVSLDPSGLLATAASGVFSCPKNARETTAQLAGNLDAVLAALGRTLPAGTLCGASVQYAPITKALPQGTAAACSFDLESAPLTGTIRPDGGVFDDYILSTTLPALHQDYCDSLALATGCTPVDLAAPSRGPVLTWTYDSYLPGGLPAYYSQTISQSVILQGTVTRACVLQPQDHCSELATCASGGGESTFGPTKGRVSGDSLCLAGPLGAALAMDRNADLPESDLSRLGAGTMLTACYDDLAQAETATAPAAPDAYDLASIFHDGRCLDGPRFLVALALAMGADRAHAADPSAPIDLRSSAYAQRLLQRWVALHAWLARDAADQEQLADVIRAAPQPGIPPPRHIDDVLAASLSGWHLFTLPRFAQALDAVPAAALYDPDYRSLVEGSPVAASPSDEQPAGLPVGMLEAMQSQLRLAEIRLDKALFVADPTAQKAASDVLRWVELMRPVALDLVARAMAESQNHNGAPPAWLAREQHADASVVDLLNRVVSASQALHQGKNPFGIDDSELPLYFLGDSIGPGGRFAAISDYLLGPPQNTTAWAPALVQKASDDLSAARAAWLAQQDRQLQVHLAAIDQTQKVEGIASQYGGQILALCGDQPGLSDSDVLDHDDLDPRSCFIKTENPACTPKSDDWLALVKPPDLKAQLCQVKVLTTALGDGVGYQDPGLQKIAKSVEECSVLSLVKCISSPGTCMKCTRAAGDLIAKVGFSNLHAKIVPTGADDIVKSAKETCASKNPEARIELPGLDELPIDPLDQGTCYRGSLGELALTARSAAKDVDIARSQYDSLQQSYDIAMQSCFILQAGDQKIEQVTEAHNETMHKLRIAKAACDSAAAAAGAVKDCASAAKDDLTFGAASGVACGAAVVQAAAQIASIGLQASMDDAQADHDALVSMLQDNIDQQRCFNDAKQDLVGARTATLQVEKAMIDLQVAIKNLDEAKESVPGLYADGRAAVVVV